MTDILFKWLNEEVTLSKHITSFEKDFANGYFFGELFFKYNVQSDFRSFLNFNSNDCKLLNFNRLENTFKNLDIKLGTKMTSEIMEEKKGVAAKLLYATKIALEKMSQDDKRRDGEDSPPSLADVQPISLKIDKQKIDQKYQEQLKEKMKKKQMRKTMEASMDVISSIENFEKTLKHFSFDSEVQKAAAAAKQQPVSLGLTAPSPLIPAPQKTTEQQSESKFYLQKIKMKKEEEVLARHERDKRRRKVLLEQQQAQKEIEDKRGEEILLEKLMRQSQEERRLAARIMETRNKKDEIRQHRVVAEEKHAAERQKEFEAILETDAQVGRGSRKEYELRADIERQKFQEFEKGRLQTKRDKHIMVCNRIVNELTIDYKIMSHGIMFPKKELREWKTLFISGIPLYPEEDEVVEQSVKREIEEVEPVDSPTDEDTILDDRDFIDYLKGKGEWVLPLLSNGSAHSSSISTDETSHTSVSHNQHHQHNNNNNHHHNNNQVLQNNFVLGKIVETLFEITSPNEPLLPPPVIPTFPLCACVIGKSLAGKTTIIDGLKEKYKIHVISVPDLVSRAMESMSGFAENSTANDLASQVEKGLKEGKQIDDAVAVKLIVTEIREISQRHHGDSKEVGGWIIDGFPNTAAQAQLLEKELTGYDVPLTPKTRGSRTRGRVQYTHKYQQPPPPPTAYRQDLKSSLSKRPSRRSQIASAPSTEESIKEIPQSGIDLVLRVSVDDEVVIRRAVGRRLDPVTGVTYHLEYHPPPEHKGVHQRLVVVEEGNTSSLLYQHLSNHKDEQVKLEKWFTRFGNMKDVDGSQMEEDIIAQIQVFIEEIISNKEKKNEDFSLTGNNSTNPSTPALNPSTPASSISAHPHTQNSTGVPGTPGTTTSPPTVTPIPPHLHSPTSKPPAKGGSSTPVRHSSSDIAISSKLVNEIAKTTEVVEVTEKLQLQHHPSLEIEEHAKTFDVELARLLTERFHTMELYYTNTAKNVLRKIRRERKTIST